MLHPPATALNLPPQKNMNEVSNADPIYTCMFG